MIKGKNPSIFFQNNILTVSKIDNETFNISNGVVFVGGNTLFFEQQSVNISSLNFPFRIGIEIKKPTIKVKDVTTYNIAEVGKNIKPADVSSKLSLAQLPNDFSKLDLTAKAYDFNDRKVENPFKSLAIVEKKNENIILNQHTYGPLIFVPVYKYSEDKQYVYIKDLNIRHIMYSNDIFLL